MPSRPSRRRRSTTAATTAFLYNASWKSLAPENTGTYFIDAITRTARPQRLHLDIDSVQIHDTKTVATQPARRLRLFDRKTKKGTSDHLAITAVLNY